MDFKEQLLELDQCKKALQGEIILCDSLRAENQSLKAENARLQAIIDEANAQEPVAHAVYQGCLSGTHVVMLPNAEKKFSGYLYAAPIPAQQSTHKADTSNCGNNEDGVVWGRYITFDGQQQSPAMAVPDLAKFDELRNILWGAANWHPREWAPIGALIDDIEKIIKGVTIPSPRITEQDAREIIKSFEDFADEDESAYGESEWLTYMAWKGHDMLNKLNNSQ